MIRPLLRLSRFLHVPRLAPIVMIPVLSVFILSCGFQIREQNPQFAPAAMVLDIRVTEGKGKTIVELEGEEPMIYTTFRLSDPDRLVIDMAGVDLSRFSNGIQMDQGPIRAIRPGSGGGSNVARLEFELSGVVEADVRTEGLNLVVEVTQVEVAPKGFVFFEEETRPETPSDDPLDPKEMMTDIDTRMEASSTLASGLPDVDPSGMPDIAVEVAEVDMKAEVAVSADTFPPLQKMDDPQAEMPEEKETLLSVLSDSLPIDDKEAIPLPKAKKVSGLRFESGEELKLIVSSDGVLSPRTFFIGSGDKRRLVIDLPGVKIRSKQRRVTVDDHRVKQVRIGQHKQKLRLVLDLLSPISYSLMQYEGDLEILIGDPLKKEHLEAKAVPSDGPTLEHPQSAGSDVTMKSMGLSIPIPSPGLASATTLPLSLPVLDAENETEVAQAEQAPQESKGNVLQGEEMLESLPPEFASEENTLTQVVDNPDEGRLTSEKITPESDLFEPSAPVEAEAVVTFSPPEPPSALPLFDLPDENAVSEETALISESQDVKLAQEKTAKKKVILRRKRRETAAAKREAIALSHAAEEAEVVVSGKYTGRKISLDFQDAEVVNVVRLIADVSGLNFVMGDDVKGKVTVKLNNVPWDQALEIILEIRNLGMERQGDILRIATLANLTKQRNEKAEARETKNRAEALTTRVIYINYAKATKMKTLLLKLLSARGEIMVASRVNALVVKDIAATLDEIEKMVKHLDTKTPQVLIEARIVEVQPSFKRSLGVQWGADFKTNSAGNSIGIGTFSGPGSSIFNPVPDFAVNVPAASPLGGVGFSFGRFTESPFQLDLRISAGEAQEMTRIVSTPKIMVLDNNEALIKQGAKIPFQSSSANGGTNIQMIDASLQLRVTPHISPDGGILLELHLTKNEPGPPVQGSTQPTIFEKEVSTQVLLMDGETMVIGGIYETKKTESESGIPFLKDIPGLGWLFKNKETSESTTELLIFITPTVMS